MANQLHKKSRELSEVSHLFFTQGDVPSDLADGCLILDQQFQVCFANPKAKQLLSNDDQQLVGQLFNFTIQEDETTPISILNKDGTWGIGRMYVENTNWQGEDAFLVSIME